MEMISEILKRYDTDKVNPHTYGDTYDLLFSEFDKDAPLNILEIGTQKGGSLCAWKEYFPNAKVTGLDIVDVVKPEYKKPDINYVICDVRQYQTDETFDIVIDDGSHWLRDVVFSVDYYSKKLRKNGIMVIEDVQNVDVWLPTINTLLSPELEYNNGFRWKYGLVNQQRVGMEDNVLIIIKRML